MNKLIVTKRDGSVQPFDSDKIRIALRKCFKRCRVRYSADVLNDVVADVEEQYKDASPSVEDIQNIVERVLMRTHPDVAKEYILYRRNKERIREWVRTKEEFIERYKQSSNTANATVDDNSNVGSKNIAVANAEIHKEDNIQINRRCVVNKLNEIFPDFDAKQYERDLNDHIIYKHDESSMGVISPYCVAVSMYRFLTDGIKNLGGLSAHPKNLDSYCGMLPNFIFSVAGQFAGAVAVPEALLYFDYFCRKEWGNNYYLHLDDVVNPRSTHPRTIQQQIHQHYQQIVYSINQISGSRNMQSAFVNFSYFDRPFYDAMFGNFYFPDGTQPQWESLCWVQKDFMMWFNEERLKVVLTFPVESFALIYQDGDFVDKDSADFVAEEYERGHSFFTYISDSVDSLSSCCRLKNKIHTKEFTFTNGNIGLEIGSKSVITCNVNRIVQNYCREIQNNTDNELFYSGLQEYINNILERVYHYHVAYNELLWDMMDAHLLSVYDAGFIDLNKQYLTIGINGLNQAAEYLGMECSDNDRYQRFCQTLFSIFKNFNEKHNGTFNNHKLMFNTEMVPAESLGVKNYNWDKEDDYVVGDDTNLYASYVYKPNDKNVDIFEKICMHGRRYIGDYLDGGSAAHLNLEEHLTKRQYERILRYAAEQGCQYLTFNVPMTECLECGHIVNRKVSECPACGSENIQYWTRIIGYLTAVPRWSKARQEEFETRVFEKVEEGK